MPKETRESTNSAKRKAAAESPIKKEKKKIKKEPDNEQTVVKDEPEAKVETKENNMVYGEILPADEKQLIDLIQAFPKVYIRTLLYILIYYYINHKIEKGKTFEKFKFFIFFK